MKKTAIVILVLAVTALALPAVFGLFTERQVHARIDQLNDDGLIAVGLRDYDRGWFSSTARIELGTGFDRTGALASAGAATGNGPLPAIAGLLADPVPVVVRITHGPLALTDRAHFGFSSMHATADADDARVAGLLSTLDIPYLFEFRGHSSFDGALAFEATVPAVEHAAMGGELRFSGAELSGRLHGRRLVSAGRIDTIDLDAGIARLSLQGLRASGDNEFLTRHVMLGPFQLLVEQMTVESVLLGPQPVFDGAGLDFRSEARLHTDGTLLNGEMRSAFRNMSWMGQIELTDGAFGMGLSNLDVAAWQALLSEIENATTDPALQAALFPRLEPLIVRLLGAGPSLQIQPLSVRVDDRPLSASARIDTDPAALPPAAAFSLGDVSLWVALLGINAEASASKDLVEQIATEAARLQIRSAQADGAPISEDEIEAMAEQQASLILLVLLAQGMIEDDGESYTTDIRLTNGTLTVNGTALAVPGTGVQ